MSHAMTTDATAEQDRTERVRAVAKAEALIEAAADLGGSVGIELNRQAETYLRRAANLHPLIPTATSPPHLPPTPEGGAR